MKKIIALVAVMVMAFTGSAFAGSIQVKGSTTVLPLMQKSAEAFMKANPNVSISISGGGSSNGAKALIDGTTDIAMMSRDMKDKEIKKATDNGRKPVQFIVALDCIVPVVNPGNPVSKLSKDQLWGIYTGKITNWKDVGGDDAKIVVISRDTSSGTYDCWKSKVMKKDGKKHRVFPGALLQASNGAVAQAVSKNKKAIGYVGLAYLNKELKGVEVNGVLASVATAKDGSYPVSRGLNLYTPGEPTGESKALLDYMMSPAGQKLAADTGFIPVK
ncbi:PstS family phosphate ABC transporter substrate-binding protein [Desulfovibrio sp. JC010]|uniref:PstS family phosphate ABC transporter substrate-binding protein n=1 Tax=Desulfovibrio sp. JC010 TaxID=2593641 RepID=UPI0013D3E120|nr:PstS family phosphate ABC transporter substrate-binding protein [Desulfovibrio sp. JC010]NDV27033.1 PstS family phosphate ABC transporter substrate-binding protein [Desulfovibrio sp. JC010]